MSPTLFKIIAWILTITTLFGNCFIIIIIVSRKHLRSSKLNWFIISLAVADFLVGLSFYPPLFFCERWISCHTSLMKSFRWIFVYSSVCNLCAMTVDRYLAITSPIYHRTKVSERVVVVWIALSWLVPSVLRGVIFIPLYYVDEEKALKYGLPILLVIFEALPCLLILFAVVRISIIAKRQKLQHRNKSKGRANQAKDENQRSSTALRMILFVAFFFIFCYLFEVYYATCKTFFKLCKDAEILQMIQRLFLIANSAVNPFAYAYLKRDIKEEVKSKIYAGLCRKRNLEMNAQPNTEPEVQSVNLDEIL